MMLPTSLLALSQLVLSSLTPQTQPTSPLPPTPRWSGDLPAWPPNAGASVSACTFAVGPPGPPASALCPAFNAFCASFRDEMRARRIRTLKTTPPLTAKPSDDDNPLSDVHFRTGCTGGTTTASDGSYISGYTATCIVDGIDWIPYVFLEFLKAEFAEKGKEHEPLPIYTSFIGCQIPAHL